MRRYYLAPLLFGAPLAAGAAPTQPLEEIVVTASRVARSPATIPNTITVVDEAELKSQLAVQYDLSTVLGNLIPSFSPSRQKMTNAGESLRGRKPLYMIDGVPQSNPLRNGGRDGHTIDPAVIERVEVVHGANAIQGLGAAGGIINLITKKPTDELSQSVRLDTAWQSEDFGESLSYGGSYSVANRFERADILASLSYRSTGMAYDANGDLIGVDNTQGDTADSQAVNAFIKSGYAWLDQRLELMVNHYKIESNHDWISVPGDVQAGIPSGAVAGALPGEGARNQVTTISVNYDHDDFLGQTLKLQLFRQDFAATYGAESTPLATFQDPALGADLLDQSQNNSEKVGIKLTLAKNNIGGAPVDIVYGLDGLQDETWQALIQTGRTWVPQTRYRNYAPFVQVEYDGIDRLNIVGGVRYEKSKLEVDDFTTLASYGSQFVEGGSPEFDQTLPNLGATYQLSDAWRVFANYAEAFSMPDVGRVLRGINVPGQSVETFLDLQPILNENTEAGVAYASERLSAQLSYYRSESDFGQRLQRGGDGIYTVKREKTEINGAEFSGDWQATPKDLLGLRLAITEGRYDANQDGRVDSDLGGSNIAPDRANLSWQRDWSERWHTRAQVNYFFDRDFENIDGDIVSEFDGYVSLDLVSRWRTAYGTWSLAIQNLGNTDYYTYYSQVNANDARNFKGMGRSYALNWQRQF